MVEMSPSTNTNWLRGTNGALLAGWPVAGSTRFELKRNMA